MARAFPEELLAQRLVPVVVIDDVAAADPLADALVAGGLPLAEVTFRTQGAPEAIRRMARRGDLAVGAGTVLTVSQVDQAVEAGASFIVSPGFDEHVLNRAEELGTPAMPGTVTASEIQRALAVGIRTVKFFPAGTSGGSAAIHALAAPFGAMRFVPTGGVGPDNLAQYLSIPAVAAVGGSWMVPRGAIAAGQFAAIRDLVAAAVAQAAQIVKRAP
jgi:2-dehydro-3-deoxyphosphogluconate aldolase/(4S)-4-hydroxy-2-oxoglutarate aldolase